jgi:hypothetical protein
VNLRVLYGSQHKHRLFPQLSGFYNRDGVQWMKYVKHNNIKYKAYNVTAGLHVSTLTELSSGPHDTDPFFFGAAAQRGPWLPHSRGF